MDCPKKTKYTIRRGDTLFRLAHIFKTTEEKILELNPGLDPMYLQIGRIIDICPNTAGTVQAVHPLNEKYGAAANQLALHDRFRELWEQHIMFTRMVINAVVDPEPDDDAVTARLLRNPKDFAQVYQMFYGDAAAREIDRLISEHLTLGKQLIVATVQGDSENAGELNSQWYQNADEWAAYLSNLSPNINEAAMREMLHSHLDMINEEVAARMDKNYLADIIIYDKAERMVLEMADMMSGAILRQFPERFD